VLTNPLGRLVLFGVCALTFAHAAHRFRHTLVDLGMKPMATTVAIVCYAVGLLLTVWAAIVAFG
jgi:fumarate reductase subunit D